jgi:Tol biopolymer transport system component
MKKLLACTALTIALAASVDAQAVATQLERARHIALVTGDLDGAAQVYRRLSETAAATRSEVAESLLRLGHTLEQMGDTPGASQAYIKVTSEYGDQDAVFVEAQSRLRELEPSTDVFPSVLAADYELLLAELPSLRVRTDPPFEFSSDGSRMILVTDALPERRRQFPNLEQELYIQDLHSGAGPQPLIEDSGDWAFISRPDWSPDDSKVLFRTLSPPGPSERRSILILDMESGMITPFQESAEVDIRTVVWTPDSRNLIVKKGTSIQVMDQSGNLIRTVSENIGSGPQIVDVSPDGRRLLYHAFDPESQTSEDVDVFVLDMESGESTRLTDRAGMDWWPIWDHDGTSIVFSSDRDGTLNIYRYVDGGGVQKLTTYANSDATYPRRLGDGEIGYTLVSRNPEVMVGPADNPNEARMLARGTSGILTPDLGTIVYVTPDGSEVRSLDMESGSSIVLLSGEIAASYASRDWISPNGSTFATFIREGNSTILYTVPVGGGTPQRMYSLDGRHEGVAIWSPDGSELAFVDGANLLVMPADGGRPDVLATADEWESWSIRYSPDGSHVAGFVYFDGEEGNHIVSVDRATGAVSRVTSPEETAYKEILDWHPDGRHISYMTYEDNDGSKIVNVETGVSEWLPRLDFPMWDYMGFWGPDGTYHFSAVDTGVSDRKWNTFRADPATGTIEPFISSPDHDIALYGWSPDGSMVVFSRTSETRQLWKLTNY